MGNYPKPVVPYEGHSDLHFADEPQFKSSFDFGTYDRGELTLSPGRISFRGMHFAVECVNISAVRVVKKEIPWMAVITIGVVVLLLIQLAAPMGAPWQAPTRFLVLGIVGGTCAFRSLDRWVEVVFYDGVRERRAYFRREPLWFGRGATRTQRLFDEIKDEVLG